MGKRGEGGRGFERNEEVEEEKLKEVGSEGGGEEEGRGGEGEEEISGERGLVGGGR